MFQGWYQESPELSKCWQCRLGCNIICLWLNEHWKIQFGQCILLISFRQTFGHAPPSSSYINSASFICICWNFCMQYCTICEIVHIAQPGSLSSLTLPSSAFSILLILWTCKIAQTVSDSNYNQVQQCFRLSGSQSRIFSNSHILLLLPNHCLGIFNLLSYYPGFSFNIILDPFLFLCIVKKVCFLRFICPKHLFGSQAAHRP